MQQRDRLDQDTRMIALRYIRKYDEYRLWYAAERDRILQPSPGVNDGMPHGTGVSDPALSAVVQLDKLEHSHRAGVVKAIDEARDRIALTVDSQEQRGRLKRAIWLSCLNGREYNFDVFAGAIPCERTQFYKYKRQFLGDIKNRLEL